MTNGVEVIIHRCNLIWGGIVAFLSYIFGTHWVLFAAFFALNICDYITGYMKSRMKGKVSSKKGSDGAWKKLGYWLMIALAFGVVVIFEEIGQVIGVDLSITSLLGWFVLSTLIINEIRSIIENFVEAGFKVPNILSKGLEVANKMLDDQVDEKRP